MSTYALNLDSLAPPALPAGVSDIAGSFATSSDGTHVRIRQTTTSTVSTLVLPSGAQTPDLAFNFKIYFDNIANPVSSYVYPGIQHQLNGDEYQIVLSRGTGEARGALWVQKFTTAGGNTDLPTYVGASGTTFTLNDTYLVTGTATGSGTRTFAIVVQRVSDRKYLKSDGTWQVAIQTALSVSDASSPLPAIGNLSLNFYATTLDGYVYDAGCTNAFDTFTRYRTTPVLTKGGSYSGWAADALAAPEFTYDGTRYLMNVSLWSISAGKWSIAFFSSPDAITWSYLSGSLLSPSGGDYLLGNSGFIYWAGKYWHAYSHYPSPTPTGITLAYSTDPNLGSGNWTIVADYLIAGNYTDAHLVENVGAGTLELWFIDKTGATPTIAMWNTTTGTTGVSWTNRGSFLAKPDWGGANYGEPSVYYSGTVRYLTFDSGTPSGVRSIGRCHSISQDTTWIPDGMALSKGAASWETIQAFDSCIRMINLGDGYGTVPRLMYAGSDVISATDNTDSSIGLAVISTAGLATVLVPRRMAIQQRVG